MTHTSLKLTTISIFGTERHGTTPARWLSAQPARLEQQAPRARLQLWRAQPAPREMLDQPARLETRAQQVWTAQRARLETPGRRGQRAQQVQRALPLRLRGRPAQRARPPQSRAQQDQRALLAQLEQLRPLQAQPALQERSRLSQAQRARLEMLAQLALQAPQGLVRPLRAQLDPQEQLEPLAVALLILERWQTQPACPDTHPRTLVPSVTPT